jgi:hypothetical protein
VHTSFVGKEDVTMPTRYDKDVKAKAIRLVRDHASNYDTEWTAILAIRPISCGPVRAPLSFQDTTVPPAEFYSEAWRPGFMHEGSPRNDIASERTDPLPDRVSAGS